jgi:hypothetical protein
MNIGTSTAQVNKMGAQYYLNLQNYLNPSQQNLELASNISAKSATKLPKMFSPSSPSERILSLTPARMLAVST